MPQSSIRLADGALTLIPPDGFCVDRRSLESQFAVLARCDSLGVPGAAAKTPPGLILVSVTVTPDPQVALGTALASLKPEGAEILDTRLAGPLALMQLRGPVPDGVDRRHWKGLARIGPYLLGLTAFAPTNGKLTGKAGRVALEQLVDRSRDATGLRLATP